MKWIKTHQKYFEWWLPGISNERVRLAFKELSFTGNEKTAVGSNSITTFWQTEPGFAGIHCTHRVRLLKGVVLNFCMGELDDLSSWGKLIPLHIQSWIHLRQLDVPDTHSEQFTSESSNYYLVQSLMVWRSRRGWE